MNTDGMLPCGAENDPNAPYNEEYEIREVEIYFEGAGKLSFKVPKGMNDLEFQQYVRDELEKLLHEYKLELRDLWMGEILYISVPTELHTLIERIV